MSRAAAVYNANWIIGGRVLHALLQLVVGTLSARYLGPEDYGLLHFASSVTAFAVPVMQLGLQETLVREYVEKREPEGLVMGTSLVLNLLSGFLCALGVTGFCLLSGGKDRTLICGLYSISLVFRGLELVQLRFQAALQAKYCASATLLGYLVMSVFRLWLLATGKGTAWFALSHSLEFAVAGAILLHRCCRAGTGKPAFSWKTARKLLSRSCHYIPAALLVTCFQNVDHVLLTLLKGEGANGLYTCAVTCANLTGFVFYALVDSLRPVILSSRSGVEFSRNMAGLYGLMLWLGLGQSLCFVLLARPIVTFLYGAEFAGAVPVLRVLTWNTAFSMVGAARNVWLLARERYSLLWKINLAGAVVSFGLNVLLIPRFGPQGAAAASVMTQLVTNVAVGFGIPGMQENQALLLKGLNIRNLWVWLRSWCGSDEGRSA